MLVILVLGVSMRAAADCPAGTGKPVFTRDEQPLRPPAQGTVARAQAIVIEATGRWTRTTTRTTVGAPAKVDDEHGCLSDVRKKALDGAIARARLVLDPKAKTCHVAPTSHVIYAAPRRGKQVEHDEPCGVSLDVSTGYLVACVNAALDHDATDEYVGRMCGGS